MITTPALIVLFLYSSIMGKFPVADAYLLWLLKSGCFQGLISELVVVLIIGARGG